ncbi:hypothetical protein [Cupriavidus sp. TMH.W2]
MNLTVRQGGEVRHRLSYNGALVQFLDAALYDDDRAAIGHKDHA